MCNTILGPDYKKISLLTCLDLFTKSNICFDLLWYNSINLGNNLVVYYG